MKRFHFAPLALALALGVSACDSGNDDSDADVFVGTHTVTKIEHNVTATAGTDLTAGVICATPNSGPSTTNPCAVNGITFSFRDNGTYALNVDYTTIANTQLPTTNCGGAGQLPCRREDVTFDNTKTTYVLNESAKTITLQVAATASASAIPVQASYTIDSNNNISLSLPAAIFNQIFQTTQYQGLVRVTMS